MILSQFFRPENELIVGRELYEAAVKQARQPGFYSDLCIPDTLDGRFESILLHLWMLLRCLRKVDGVNIKAQKISQGVFDTLISDMDSSLREMGVGDLRVGRRVQSMARSFYGHLSAYDESLVIGSRALQKAILRNVYATAEASEPSLAESAEKLVEYIYKQIAVLESQSLAAMISGEITFRPLIVVESR